MIEVREAAAEQDNVLRMSADAKATVKVGPFSRRGKTRTGTKACDHDFQPDTTLTPFGILLPDEDRFFMAIHTSKVTADAMVDTLEAWWSDHRHEYKGIDTLLLHLDNGPENHSRRTQFMRRLVDFSHATRLTIQLAYYPPYHSKYNPVERCWGILENSWNGDLLDTEEAVVRHAENMTWKGQHPGVRVCRNDYPTGQRLTAAEMADVETHLDRDQALPKWFVTIRSNPNK